MLREGNTMQVRYKSGGGNEEGEGASTCCFHKTKQEKNPNPLTCCCPQPFVHTRSGTRGQQARMSAQTNRTGTREDGRKGAKRQNEAIKQSEHKTKWKSSSLYTTTNHCTHHCTHHHTITQITPLTPVPMELMAAQSSWKGREEG